MMEGMTTWTQLTDDAPELAALARARIEATGLALLATLRKDGSPRISGVEPLFHEDDLWFGMMPDSRKAHDLQRDPRFALHNASEDKQVTDGDVKISGRAVELTDDEAVVASFRRAFAAASGYEPPPGPMHLFRADVTEVVTIRPAGDHLVIQLWQDGKGVRTIDRY